MVQRRKLNDIVSDNDPCLFNSSFYLYLIDKLIYLTIIRPNIFFFVMHVLNQFMHVSK